MMDICISLDYFHAQERKYHIYKITHSDIAEKEHYHDYFQLCYVAKGELCHRQGEDKVFLVQGDTFLIPPGFRHSISFISENSELYSLSFHPAIFHPGFPESNVYKFLTALTLDETEGKKISVRLRVVLNQTRQTMVKSLMDCLILEEENNPPAELTSAASLIAAIMCILSQAYMLESENQIRYSAASVYNSSMNQCIEYINSNFTRKLGIEELTKKCAMSKSAFYQLFLQTTGTTLRKYVNIQRVELAKKMMRDQPELSLSEIAHAVGYDEISTFYRNFTQEIGISPTEYRNTAM